MHTRYYRAVLEETSRLLGRLKKPLSPLKRKEALVSLNDIASYLDYVEDEPSRQRLKDAALNMARCLENGESEDGVISGFRDDFQASVSPKIYIDCLICRDTHWQPCKKLIEAFMREQNCRVRIVPTPYMTSYADGYGAALQKRVSADGLAFVDFAKYDIEKEMPDIVLIDMPYDHTKPRDFRFFRIHKLVEKTAYLEYAPRTGVDAPRRPDECFGEAIAGGWQFIVPSEAHAALYPFYFRLGGELLAKGTPEADIGYKRRIDAKTGNHGSILWNIFPANTDADYPWTMKQIDMLEAMLKRFPKVKNAVRLHPHFMVFLHSRMCVARIFALCEEHDNLSLDDSPDFYSALDKSVAFITGPGSSTIVSALAYNLPILIIHNTFPEKYLGMDMALADALYTSHSMSEAERFYTMMQEGRDPKKGRRARAAKQYLTVTDGTASQKIAREVIRRYKREEGLRNV